MFRKQHPFSPSAHRPLLLSHLCFSCQEGRHLHCTSFAPIAGVLLSGRVLSSEPELTAPPRLVENREPVVLRTGQVFLGLFEWPREYLSHGQRGTQSTSTPATQRLKAGLPLSSEREHGPCRGADGRAATGCGCSLVSRSGLSCNGGRRGAHSRSRTEGVRVFCSKYSEIRCSHGADGFFKKAQNE